MDCPLSGSEFVHSAGDHERHDPYEHTGHGVRSVVVPAVNGGCGHARRHEAEKNAEARPIFADCKRGRGNRCRMAAWKKTSLHAEAGEDPEVYVS